MEGISNKPKQVFISYCHESADHSDRVLALADRLCLSHIDCVLDRYVQAPKQGWPLWMEQNIRCADHILIVCTETYDRRARGDEENGRGRGVIWESLLTYQYLYENAHSNSKIIPIVLAHSDIDHIPQPLRGYQYYNVSNDDGFQLLYRRIMDLPLVVKPPLGQPLNLPTGTNLTTIKSETPYLPDTAITQEGISEQKAASVDVEIVINQSFDEYSEEDQAKLLEAISLLLNLKDVQVVSKRRGSVVLTLRLSSVGAEMLIAAVEAGLLDYYHVASAQEVSLIDWEREKLRYTVKPNADIKGGDVNRSGLIPLVLYTFLTSLPTTNNSNELMLAFRNALRDLLHDVDSVTLIVNVNCGHNRQEALRYALFDDEHVLEENSLTAGRGNMAEQSAAKAEHLESILDSRDFELVTVHPPEYNHYFLGESTYLGSIVLYRHKSVPPITEMTLNIVQSLAPFMRFVLNAIVSLHQLNKVTSSTFNKVVSGVAVNAGLTVQEKRILILIALGHDYNTIAEILMVSTDTIRKHMKHIYRKSGVRSRGDLLAGLMMKVDS